MPKSNSEKNASNSPVEGDKSLAKPSEVKSNKSGTGGDPVTGEQGMPAKASANPAEKAPDPTAVRDQQDPVVAMARQLVSEAIVNLNASIKKSEDYNQRLNDKIAESVRHYVSVSNQIEKARYRFGLFVVGAVIIGLVAAGAGYWFNHRNMISRAHDISTQLETDMRTSAEKNGKILQDRASSIEKTLSDRAEEIKKQGEVGQNKLEASGKAITEQTKVQLAHEMDAMQGKLDVQAKEIGGEATAAKRTLTTTHDELVAFHNLIDAQLTSLKRSLDEKAAEISDQAKAVNTVLAQALNETQNAEKTLRQTSSQQDKLAKDIEQAESTRLQSQKLNNEVLASLEKLNNLEKVVSPLKDAADVSRTQAEAAEAKATAAAKLATDTVQQITKTANDANDLAVKLSNEFPNLVTKEGLTLALGGMATKAELVKTAGGAAQKVDLDKLESRLTEFNKSANRTKDRLENAKDGYGNHLKLTD